jgi:hypothetical protein
MSVKHPMASGVSDTDYVFIETYLSTMNMRSAFKAANPDFAGAPSWYRISQTMMRCRAEIDQRLMDYAAESEVSREQLVEEMTAIAFMDIADNFSPKEKFACLHELGKILGHFSDDINIRITEAKGYGFDIEKAIDADFTTNEAGQNLPAIR